MHGGQYIGSSAGNGSAWGAFNRFMPGSGRAKLQAIKNPAHGRARLIKAGL